ncbi:MAG: helix-turn-helix domain-containing protein [Gemmatimonadales bacterium]
MQYREYPPGPSAEHVVRYWSLVVPERTAPEHQHRIVPDGCTDLIVVARDGASRLVLRGPRDTPLLIPVRPGDRYWGARIWPDSGGLLVGRAAAELVSFVGPAEPFLGAGAAERAATVAAVANVADGPGRFEAWLVERFAEAPPFDQAVRMVLLAINAAEGPVRSAGLADLVGLGPRQLQRRFRTATGLTLKTYSRIRRIRRSLGHLVEGRPRRWSEVAAALGFTDQSHLISEFTRLAGATPGEIAAYVAGIQHSDVLP